MNKLDKKAAVLIRKEVDSAMAEIEQCLIEAKDGTYNKESHLMKLSNAKENLKTAYDWLFAMDDVCQTH